MQKKDAERADLKFKSLQKNGTSIKQADGRREKSKN